MGALTDGSAGTEQGGPEIPDQREDGYREQINRERDRQRAKGYDLAHDRKFGAVGLISLAQAYARRGEIIKAMALASAAADVVCADHLDPLGDPTDAEIQAAEKAIDGMVRLLLLAADITQDQLEASLPEIRHDLARAALVAARKSAQR